ncbi:MAG: hypothetical protein K2J80_00295 [Oscillospiraceae bacterium]|nr:hypothetical protein [Oscillospiraceae bacterium]
MKKAIKVTSWLCLIVAAAAVVFGLIAMTSSKSSFFMGYAFFDVVQSGGFMGFIGNIAGIAITFLCFGLMGFYGLKGKDKNALIWTLISIIMSVISLMIVLFQKRATFGDFIVLLLPVAHLFLIFKNA